MGDVVVLADHRRLGPVPQCRTDVLVDPIDIETMSARELLELARELKETSDA